MTAAPTTPSAKAPPRRLGGSFLSGAASRLLPVSVPFRFFGAAVAFHLLAWLALLVGAADWTQWRGGIGWPLAALHLLTLGTLLASAIGASMQLLPVATRQAVRWPRLAGLLWWIYVPGVVFLVLGMGLPRRPWLVAGAALVIAALLAWALLLALNLRGARGMPGVVLHGWGALAALALLAGSAIVLVAAWQGRMLLDVDMARALHMLAGVFGVMGLLAFGLAYILLPMFALAPTPRERDQLVAGVLALAAISLAAVAALDIAALPLRWGALALAAAAWGRHARLMQRTLEQGMRRDFGRALTLMRSAWAALGLALLLAAALLIVPRESEWHDTLRRLFGLAAVGGWLLGFLLGVLQRILPFLAAMHAAHGQKRPPTPSALTLDSALAWHARGHFGALALLALATLAHSPLLTGLAAALGAGGAAAFALFFLVLLRRLRGARPPQPDLT